MSRSNDLMAIVITLPRFRERYAHITAHAAELFGDRFAIVGVDGREVAPSQVGNEALTLGQIGCALSHQMAYRLMVERNVRSALVIEDDVILPPDIAARVDELRSVVGNREVIQLYNWASEPSEFSRVGAHELSQGALYYPLATEGLGTTSAYVIGRGAAKAILRLNNPVVVTADNWTRFHKEGAITSSRVVLPQPVALRDFETTVLPRQVERGFTAVIARIKYMGIVKPLLAARRRRLLARRSSNVILTDRPSPLAPP